MGEVKDAGAPVQGTITYGNGIWNGNKYVGEFKDGGKHGQGIYIYSNGDKYVGEFKDGEKHGQGTYIKPEGRKYVGEWKDGERWNGTLFDKQGKIIGKFMNGWFDQ